MVHVSYLQQLLEDIEPLAMLVRHLQAKVMLTGHAR